MAKQKFTKKQVIEAVQESHGILLVAANRLGCARPTLDDYRKRYPEVEAALHAAKERTIDFVESKLLENIKAKKEASIFFFLKTQAKARGYIEKSELKVDGEIKTTVEYVDAPSQD